MASSDSPPPGSGLTGSSNALLDIREQAAQKLAKLIDADFRIIASATRGECGPGRAGTRLELFAL